MNQLENDLRIVILLRYEQGLSYEEIAEATGRPLGTVSKRLHTAHRKLLEILTVSGLTLALGAVTQALGAIPANAVPVELASKLRRLALEYPRGGPHAFRPRVVKGLYSKLVAIGLPVTLAGFIAILGASRESSGVPTFPRPAIPGRLAAAPPSPEPPVATEKETPEPPGPAGDPVSILVGVVRDRASRLPIRGAKVWLEHTLPWSPPAITADDGSFRLECRIRKGIEEVPYSVDAVAPGYVRRRIVWKVGSARLKRSEDGRSVTLEEAADELGGLILRPGKTTLPLIELSRGTQIRGRVVDSQGRPLTGVHVTAETQEIPADPAQIELGPLVLPPIPDGVLETWESDFRGGFVIPNLYPKGKCLLSLSLPGYATLRSSAAVKDPPEERVFVLHPGVRVQGQILDAQGHPFAGARVFAFSPPSGRFVAGASTAEDGRFSIADLREDTKYLVACVPGHGISTIELPRKDTSLSIIATEAEGSVTGVATDENGAWVEGAKAVVCGYEILLGDRKIHLAFSDVLGTVQLPESVRSDEELPSEIEQVRGYLPRSWAPPPATTSGDGRFQLSKLPLRPGVSALLAVHKDGYTTDGDTASEGKGLRLRLRKLPP